MKKRIVNADQHGTLLLGRQGENQVTEVVFSVPADLTDCEWQLNHRRATDSAAYPVPLQFRDGALVWVVTSGDTDIPGRGYAELTCYGSNGEILKSQLYATTVIKALTTGGTVPDPVQPWYESLLKRIDSIDGVSPEEIAAAVESYLEENPIESGATAEQVQQIEENTEAIEALKQAVPTKISELENDSGFLTEHQSLAGLVKSVNGVKPDENGNVEIEIPDSSQNVDGLTTAQINALDGMFKVCAYDSTKDYAGAYTAFKAAFGITDAEGGGGSGEDSDDETVKTLTSISAAYSGGEVTVGTAVTGLTGVVVTAHYSDGSTAIVSGYTLSGTISEGENTVTVTYQGKTATFTVMGVAESSGDTEENNGWTDGEAYAIEWTDGYGIDHNGTQGGDAVGAVFENSTRSVSGFMPCRGASALNVSGLYTNYGVFFYGENQEFVMRQIVVDYTAPVPVPLTAYYVRVQCVTTNKASATVAPVMLDKLTESTAYETGKHYSLNWLDGVKLNMSTGAETENASAVGRVTEFALCYGATTLAVPHKVRHGAAFYDAEKTFVSDLAFSTQVNSLTIPDGAYYFRIDTYGSLDGCNEWAMLT